jgi:hypothetical protein
MGYIQIGKKGHLKVYVFQNPMNPMHLWLEIIFLLSGSFSLFPAFFLSLEWHFPFLIRWWEGFPRDQADLSGLGDAFDLIFPPQGRGIVALGLLEDQPHGPMGGGVLASLARVMGLDALFDVLGDAGVIGPVRAFGNVQRPAISG